MSYPFSTSSHHLDHTLLLFTKKTTPFIDESDDNLIVYQFNKIGGKGMRSQVSFVVLENSTAEINDFYILA